MYTLGECVRAEGVIPDAKRPHACRFEGGHGAGREELLVESRTNLRRDQEPAAVILGRVGLTGPQVCHRVGLLYIGVGLYTGGGVLYGGLEGEGGRGGYFLYDFFPAVEVDSCQ